MPPTTRTLKPNATEADEAHLLEGATELPSARLWRKQAPEGLRVAWDADPLGGGWKQLRKLLQKRRLAPRGLPQSPGADGVSPWCWGLGSGETLAAEGVMRLLRTVAKADPRAVERETLAWLDRPSQTPTNPLERALLCVAWGASLPSLSALLDAPTWFRVLDTLATTADQALSTRAGLDLTDDALLADQLLAGELPLMLGMMLPECRPLHLLRKRASEALSEGVVELTDGEGLPPAARLGVLPALLACWTRCRAWGEASGKRPWDSAAETQYAWLVRQALRLARPDGSMALSTAPGAAVAPVLSLALRLAGDAADLAAAACRLGGVLPLKAPRGATPPEVAVNSEWSGLSVLGDRWDADGARVVVDYEGARVRMDFSIGSRIVFSGCWETSITLDGAPVRPEEAWAEQCWFSDEDCDYLEIAQEVAGLGRLERQVLVTRHDGAVYLADLWHGERPVAESLRVDVRLPLGADAAWRPAEETREGELLSRGKPVAGVLPLALPEWRVESHAGELSEEGGALRLTQHAGGQRACAPLFIDLRPKRFAKQRTWRQLTVAQSLKKVGPDVAVGYRVQSGPDQWLVYRSMQAPANRTVLGQNLSSECLIGRFLPSGEVDEYIEVDPE